MKVTRESMRRSLGLQQTVRRFVARYLHFQQWKRSWKTLFQSQ